MHPRSNKRGGQNRQSLGPLWVLSRERVTKLAVLRFSYCWNLTFYLVC